MRGVPLQVNCNWGRYRVAKMVDGLPDGPAPRGANGLKDQADRLGAELDLRIAALDQGDREVRAADGWMARLRWRAAVWLVTRGRKPGR